MLPDMLRAQAVQGCIQLMLDLEPLPGQPAAAAAVPESAPSQPPPSQQPQWQHHPLPQQLQAQQLPVVHQHLQPGCGLNLSRGQTASRTSRLPQTQPLQPQALPTQQAQHSQGQLQLGGGLMAVHGLDGQMQYVQVPGREAAPVHHQYLMQQQQQQLQLSQPYNQQQLLQGPQHRFVTAQLSGLLMDASGLQGTATYTAGAACGSASAAAAALGHRAEPQANSSYRIVLPAQPLSQDNHNIISVIPQNSGQSYSGGLDTLGLNLSGQVSLWGRPSVGMGPDAGGLSAGGFGAGGVGAYGSQMAAGNLGSGLSMLPGGQIWALAVQPDPPACVDPSLGAQEMTDESAALNGGAGHGSGGSGSGQVQPHGPGWGRGKRAREGQAGAVGEMPMGGAGAGGMGGNAAVSGAVAGGDTTDGSVSASGRDAKRQHTAPTPQFAALQSLATLDVQEALQLFFAQKQPGRGGGT